MSRLIQRSRRPTAPDSDDDSPSSIAPVRMPHYEPPYYPLNDLSKQQLADLARQGSDPTARRLLEKHLARSTAELTQSVGAINEVLSARKRDLGELAKKRLAQGQEEKDEQELALEEYIARLDGLIAELTDQAEAALRQVIDYRAEIEDSRAVLERVLAGLGQQEVRVRARQAEKEKQRGEKRVKREEGEQRRRRRGPGRSDDEEGEEEAEEEEVQAEEEQLEPLPGVKELLEAARKAKMEEYESQSAYQKYAIHNDYIEFKRTWHEAMHEDDQVPLPDPTTWFDEHGRPVKDAAIGDEDLIIEREIIDLKCPLSLQIMKDPYSNHKCKHTFEKSAIMEFIRSNGGRAKCPVCSKVCGSGGPRLRLYVADIYCRNYVSQTSILTRSSRERSSVQNSGPAEAMSLPLLMLRMTRPRMLV